MKIRARAQAAACRLFHRVSNAIIERALQREPDFIIGDKSDPYLLRWWLLPRNPVLNIYLHYFMRDDDDRALHDHPWASCSVMLKGSYIEHTIAAGGIHKRELRTAPSVRFMAPRRAHRIELVEMTKPWKGRRPCWTLFITGPRMREWGFHCPQRGWVHWREFTNPADYGEAGAGCGAVDTMPAPPVWEGVNA